MRAELKDCVALCAHAENPLLGSLPEGWLLDPVVFSLNLDGPYTTRVFLYINFVMKRAVFVCQTDEAAHSKKDDLVEYQRLFIEYFKKKEERTETGQVEEFSGWKQIRNAFLAKIAGLSWMYTGFGSGGCLAQLYAYHDEVPAISIDSPGNKTLLEKIFERDAGAGNLTARAAALLHIFLTAPNQFNTFGDQIGDVYRIKIPWVNKTSWKHIVLSALDILSVMAAWLSISSMVKVLVKQFNLSSARLAISSSERIAETLVAKASERENTFSTNFFETIRPPIPYMTFTQAQDRLRDAREKFTIINEASQRAQRNVILCGAIALGLQFSGRLSERSRACQHSISALWLSLSSSVVSLITPMRSWPNTINIPEITWGQFLQRLFWPRKGRYFYDENTYIETSQIHVLAGYVEDTRAETSLADIAPRVLKNESNAEQEEKFLPFSEVSMVTVYDASSHALTWHALGGVLGHIALNQHQFSALTELNVSNNALDDGVAHLLSMSTWMNRLTRIDLSKNYLTIVGFLVLTKALVNSEVTIATLNVAENRIFFDNGNVASFPIDHRVDVSGSVAHFESEVASDLLPADQEARQGRNRVLLVSINNRFSLFSKEAGFKSIVPWVEAQNKITADQSLVFVVANGAWISQHAFLLIERISHYSPYLKEIVMYELRVSDKAKSKAQIFLTYPEVPAKGLTDQSSKQFEKFLENKVYQSRYHPIPKATEDLLVRNLNADVRMGAAFPYRRLMVCGSGGVEEVNCATWLAGHLRAVGLPADLGWLNLPSDLVDQRSWLSRVIKK